uniref:Uncharacterized protein n=1 Tax=Utricularia reniformis TaxID=192314 RepID=A0A1Y0B4F3_9LAMI|nr:hypothetical protein AEK19_MT2052 [Utricularia reniformis]ART32209.1 hypothetical protein AEK19_MT2052 [Utricularia reniformis]
MGKEDLLVVLYWVIILNSLNQRSKRRREAAQQLEGIVGEAPRLDEESILASKDHPFGGKYPLSLYYYSSRGKHSFFWNAAIFLKLIAGKRRSERGKFNPINNLSRISLVFSFTYGIGSHPVCESTTRTRRKAFQFSSQLVLYPRVVHQRR